VASDATRPLLAVDPRREFDAHELMPSDVLPDGPRTFVVEPLTRGGEALGHVLLEYGTPEGAVYEALREQIGGALESARLAEQLATNQRECKRLLAELDTRSRQVELAHHALREGRHRLPSSESVPPGSNAAGPAPSLAVLFEHTLDQLVAVLRVEHAFVALVPAEGKADVDAPPLGLAQGDPRLVVGPVHGRFGPLGEGAGLEADLRTIVLEALGGAPRRAGPRGVAIPAVRGTATVAVMYIERDQLDDLELELARTLLDAAAAATPNRQ
jgi:hypothetical protein